MAPKSNKLNIYLLKENHTDFQDIITGGTAIKLDQFTTLYYQPSISRTPDWVETFFGDKIGEDHRKKMKVSGIQAVLLVKVNDGKRNRIFALTFGHGRFMIADGVIEERFGLKTVLNQITDKEVQNMEKRAFARMPKQIREQLSKVGDISNFELDIERDLIESITGKATNAMYGRTLTGKDAYSLSGKVDYTNLMKFLKDSLAIYLKDTYKTHFKWIDQISPIKDSAKISELDELLVDKINAGSPSVWLGLPTFIDWEAHAGFKYSTRKTDDLVDAIELDEWKESFEDEITIDELKGSVITNWDGDDSMIGSWSVYRCIYGELTHNGKAYFLTDGKWYIVDRDYVREINNYIRDNITWEFPTLDSYDHDDENEYNTYLAGAVNGYLLDAQNLTYGGGSSKVEFCDVISDDREMYFVKKYSGSATLSHLFMQGLVSGELLAFDKQFRIQVRNKVLPATRRTLVPEINLNPANFEIIFLIIQKKLNPKSVKLPFFSKITLRRMHQRLQGYKYIVRFQFVNNEKP